MPICSLYVRMCTGMHVVRMKQFALHNGMVILYVGRHQIYWHTKSIIGWQGISKV